MEECIRMLLDQMTKPYGRHKGEEKTEKVFLRIGPNKKKIDTFTIHHTIKGLSSNAHTRYWRTGTRTYGWTR